MDQNSVNCDTIDQKKELDHFQKLDNKTKRTEEEYRVEHTELENDLEAFIREFRNYKREFYFFVEKLINNIRVRVNLIKADKGWVLVHPFFGGLNNVELLNCLTVELLG